MGGRTESDADRGERGTCQDHLIVLVFKWLRCPDCRGAEGAAPRETMNSLKGWSERERGGELQKCRSCRRDATSAAAFASAVAVIVVWRGKERVDTKQLSLGAEERWERVGRINEPGSYKMQAYRIVCQNGAAPAAFAPSDGRGRGAGASHPLPRVFVGNPTTEWKAESVSRGIATDRRKTGRKHEVTTPLQAEMTPRRRNCGAASPRRPSAPPSSSNHPSPIPTPSTTIRRDATRGRQVASFLSAERVRVTCAA